MTLASGSAAAAGIPVAVAVGGEPLRGETLDALRKCAAHIASENCWAATVADLVANVARIRPAIVVVGVPDLPGGAEEALSSLRRLEPPPRVIAVSDRASPESIVEVMRAGASEFLYLPFGEGFGAALERTAGEWLRSEEARSPGAAIGFVSAKGGCGVTTLAVHSAVFLQQCMCRPVLLADLDVRTGMAASLFQLAPRFSVADALQNLDRLDSTLWQALVASAAAGVDLIAAPPAPSDLGGQGRKLCRLVRMWRQRYAATVIDFGAGLTPLLADLQSSLDTLVVVSSAEVAALRQAKQIMQMLSPPGRGAGSVRLILNRMPRRTELPLPELERLLGFPVFRTVPNDYATLAAVYGKAGLLSADSHLGGHMARLAEELAGVPSPARRKKRRFGLFG